MRVCGIIIEDDTKYSDKLIGIRADSGKNRGLGFMLSIFDRFKRKHSNEEEYEEQGVVQETVEEPGPEVEEADEPVERLLTDIMETQEQYPGDMHAIEFFLPALRERLESHEIKCQAAEALSVQDPEKVLEDGEGERVEIPPVDAKCNVYIPSDKMTAFVCIFSPIAGGAEITGQDIMDALKADKVIYGVDMKKVDAIAEGKEYGILFSIARGMPQSNGEDGYVVDHYSRQEDVGLKEDERGNVDHKSLRRFQSIQEGELICEIIPPTEGEDGVDVTGKLLKAKAGRVPKVPQGKNTVLSEDGTRLSAGIDGDISFNNGAFHVQCLLTITGSVDNAVGNLDYNGDILIQEDVMSGFQVCATGNIIVRGMVSGATLRAGGDIEIARGMNGNGQGMLEARGNVKLSFMENANVICYQNVYAATIINSNITCGGSVIVKDGKGILIGGSITVRKGVEAKRIGNQSGCENVIKLGQGMEDEESLEYLHDELKDNRRTLDELQKNINYLKGKGSLPAAKQEILKKLQVQSVLYIDKIDALTKKIERLEKERTDFSECVVQSDIVYPMTKISLDYAQCVIRDTTSMCRVHYQDGELMVGIF